VRKIILLLVFFSLVAATAGAQTTTVSGVVKDESGGVVSGATVIVRGAAGVERQTITGPDGRFTVDVNAPADAALVVRAGGFAEWQRPLAGQREVDVVLKAPRLLESVTVTPSRTAQRLADVPASVSVIDQETIHQSPAVVVDDVLREVPSFSLFRRSSSLSSHPTSQGVSLRGIGPSGVSRTLVMTDGVPVNDPFGGWVYWTRVPLESVDRIEIVEGPTSSLYGNYAEGGVINIVTQRPTRRTVELKPQYGNRTSPKFDFFGSDVWGKVGVAVEGSLFKTDGFPIVAPDERGAIDINATEKFQNVNTKVDYAPNERVQTSFRVGYFNEDRGNGKIDEVNDTRWTTASGNIRLRLPDSSQLEGTLFGDFEKFHSTFLAVSTVNGVPRSAVRLTLDQHVPSNSVGGMVQWSRALGATQFFTAGTDWRWVDGDSKEDAYSQVGPVLAPVTNSALSLRRISGGTQQSTGAFVQDIINPIDRLSITLSGRIDYWHSYDAHNDESNVPAGTPGPGDTPSLPEKSATMFSPRAAAIYRVSDRVNVYGNVSTGFRAPTLNELYRQFRVGATLTLANFDLDPERLVGGEGGVNVAVNDHLSVRGTIFTNRVTDPVFNVTTSIVGASVTQQRRNVPRTGIHGVQLETEFRAGPFRARAAYIHDDARVKEADTPPSPIIPSILGKFLAQVPRNRGSVQLSYSNPRVATVAFNVQAAGDQFDDDLNTRVLPAYGVADLSVSRTISRQLDVFFGVQNLFDKQYIVGTLPTTIGAPRLVNGGVRIRLAGR
jgi:outer membrane receptor protein involved in Fe transport